MKNLNERTVTDIKLRWKEWEERKYKGKKKTENILKLFFDISFLCNKEFIMKC